MTTAHRERLQRLGEAMAGDGVDAMICSTPISMGYLHGLWEDGHERFLALAVNAQGAARLICPALSAEQARRMGIEDVRPWADGDDPMVHFRQLASDWDLKSGIVAVDDHLPAKMLLQMQDAAPAANFRPGGAILGRLRARKDAAELDAMRRAAQVVDDVFEEAKAWVAPGVTEVELAAKMEAAVIARGGKPSFCIIATGANGAEPHHHNDATPIQRGHVVVLDFGCSVDGYQSDITRCVACAEATDEQRRVYAIVNAAQAAAREKAAAGVPAQEVDRAARRVIAEAGYGERFVHRTGHGIGLSVHEEPYIVEGADRPLEVGNCFSVEPGIYLPGQFGVRLENIMTIGQHGAENLNAEHASELTVVG